MEVTVRVVLDLPHDWRPDLMPNPLYFDREASEVLVAAMVAADKHHSPQAAWWKAMLARRAETPA